MKISIIGTGYVGLVSGVGFAEAGHDVICMDVNEERIEGLNIGLSPIYEPGLADMLRANIDRHTIGFTTSIQDAVDHAEVIFIAVGTPPSEDGSADLGHVLAVASEIGRAIKPWTKPLLVIVKSTVPVGTCDKVRTAIQAELETRPTTYEFSVASNPEFLAEGSAVKDFMNPSRIVAGVENEESGEIIRKLYEPFSKNHEKLLIMDVHSSELTKYSANAMLATKISLMNELSNIADRVGADIEMVRKGIGSDPRIGHHFIYAGPGYGGSCFPKDVRALAHTASEGGFEAKILNAVEHVNMHQKTVLFSILQRAFDGDLSGLNIAIWGLSFKPNTDDIREAPSLVLIDALLGAGAIVHVHDPEALDEAGAIYSEHQNFHTYSDPYDATKKSDALVMVTEWKQYWVPDYLRLSKEMSQKILVDARNIWSPETAREHGFQLYAIGRPTV